MKIVVDWLMSVWKIALVMGYERCCSMLKVCMFMRCLYEEYSQIVTVKMVYTLKSFEFVTYESGEEFITQGMRMMVVLVVLMM